MTPDTRLRVRRALATLNLASIALIVPGLLYHYVFRMPPGTAPGSRTVLVVLLALVWLALSTRPVVTPSGRPWPFWLRALVFVGGNLTMALVMFLLAGR